MSSLKPLEGLTPMTTDTPVPSVRFSVRAVPVIHEAALHTVPEPWGLFRGADLVETFPTRAEAQSVRRMLVRVES